MKVAIVWNYPSRLLDCSFRFEQYVAGLERLGHEPLVVCTQEAGQGFDAPMLETPHLDRFLDPAFWRQVAADAAIIVTWHRMPEVLGALQAAGTRVIALSDTDGRPGNRLYWQQHFLRQVHYRRGALARLRFTAGWLMRQARERLAGPSWEEAVALLSTRRSDVVAMGHEGGRQNLLRFLRQHGASELEDRVVEVPFTIGSAFFACEVPAEKQDRIVAIGRWDDAQKNAPLLVAALRRLLARRPNTEVELLGNGGEAFFRPLQEQFGNLRYRGRQEQAPVADTLAASRCIVFSSRWEGCPHAAMEALSLGATVVGTPIPSLQSWQEQGRFGTIAEEASARSLAAALAQELRAWDRGERDAHEISRLWRQRVRPEQVCGALLDAMAARPRVVEDSASST